MVICEQIRNSSENSVVPILLVIGRYQITQANAVKHMGNITFIITPFNEQELRNRIAGLLESS